MFFKKNRIQPEQISRMVFSALIIGLFLIASFPVHAAKKVLAAPVPQNSLIDQKINEDDLLNESQISYRAEGGFTGINSYGVVISCVRGQISVLKTIFDPRVENDRGHIRQVGSMSKEAYLNLWSNLRKNQILKAQNAPPLNCDSLDEFTVVFDLKVGKREHEFRAEGITRPEASRYFAFRCLIDGSVNMAALWQVHQSLALNIDTDNQ